MSADVSRFGLPTEALALPCERLPPIDVSKSLHIWDLIRKSWTYATSCWQSPHPCCLHRPYHRREHSLRHGDDRRQASNDDGQHVLGHHLFGDALVAMTPLHCRT